MSSLIQIPKRNQLATMALGLVIAVFSVIAPYHYVSTSVDHLASEQTKSADCEHSDNSATENPVKEQIVKALDAVPNVLQISFPSVIATNVPAFDIEAQEFFIDKSKRILYSTTKHFKTLFRRIISPNAP